MTSPNLDLHHLDLHQRLLALSPRQRTALAEKLQRLKGEPVPQAASSQLVAYVVPSPGSEIAPAAVKSVAKSRLPNYMVPADVVVLAKLPLNANGKIDINALPVPQKAARLADSSSGNLSGSVVAPTTPIETTLVDIWKAVLGLDELGIHDNFFELGGDSILSIQIVSKAREAGLRLAPNQLFDYSTIAELAAVVTQMNDEVPETLATQSVVTGPVPLTSIQHWFVSQKMAAPYHWHQARVLVLPVGVARTRVESAIAALWHHHDALRLRFTKTGEGWQQMNAGVEHPPAVEWIDIAGLADEEQKEAVAQHGSRLHESVSESSPNLMKVACFTRGEAQPSWLLLSLHHWIVDGVSWQILQDDLERLLLKEKGLPDKTTSYKVWAETLVAKTRDRLSESEFWYAQVESPAISLLDKTAYTGPLNEAVLTELATGEVTDYLNETDTQTLLTSVPAAYNTQINDVLLTALTQALLQWKSLNSGSVLIEVEGHGREFIAEEIDLSRTVGWCTMTYPICLSVENVGDCGGALKSIKEQLRQVPDGGIGYGMLRYLAVEEAAGIVQELPGNPLPLRLVEGKVPEVLFNYLGRSPNVTQVEGEQGLSLLPDVNVGRLRHPQNRRGAAIEINAVVTAGQLRCTWRYDRHLLLETQIEQLATLYFQQLKAIIAHCEGSQAGGFTPSDFPDVDLEQGELDSFISQLTGG